MVDSARISKITANREVKTEAAYSDFMTNFNRHPETGKLMRNLDKDAVKRGIRNLIQTSKGEKLFRPDYGCDVRKMLFENFSPQVTNLIKTHITDAIEIYEPRVQLLDVVVIPNETQHLYNIMIVYEILSSNKPETLNLTLNRVR